jgi:hypothetical protein
MIDKQAASVATSPAMEKPTVTEAARQYLAEIGRKGGKNNKHQAAEKRQLKRTKTKTA